jgi:hypothetical protein
VVGGVRGAGREIDEERLVGHQRLLLVHPLDRLVRQVLGEVVALLRGPVGLDRNRVAIRRGRPLVSLGTDEPVEVLEPAAAGRHASNGPIGLVSHTGTSWHLPNCTVAYPLSLSVSANGAAVLGRTEL